MARHVPRAQVLVPFSDELVDRLDRYRGPSGRSRSDVIREATEADLAADREARIDREIVEAYTRRPREEIRGRGSRAAPHRSRALVTRGGWPSLPAARRRPACVLARGAARPVLTSVLVAPATRTIRGIGTETPLGRSDGMPEGCVLAFDALTTVPQGSADRAHHRGARGAARRAV
jgi:mRNA-degrading endonuclease toxin of MazEF toxin-antitoxin module